MYGPGPFRSFLRLVQLYYALHHMHAGQNMDCTTVYAFTHNLLHAVCTESGQVGPSWHPHREARWTGLMHMQHGYTGPRQTDTGAQSEMV